MAERWTQLRQGVVAEHRAWTPEEFAFAKRERELGASALAIGRRLGRTRNSVIGKLHSNMVPGFLVNQNPRANYRAAMRARPSCVAAPSAPRAMSWEQVNG